MSNKAKVFIVSQPFFPVPATNDGAIPFVIQDTIDSFNSQDILLKVISTWEDKMNMIDFDKDRFYFVDRKSLFLRVAKRLFTRIINSGLMYRITYTKYLNMLFGILWYSIIDKPEALIVHTTRSEWVINLKKFFAKRGIKVVWYHHMSDDQNTDENHLKQFPLIDAHIFVSNHSKDKFTEKIISYDKEICSKSYVIRNGINIKQFIFNPQFRQVTRKQYNISEDTTLILFVGKLIPRKGFHQLLSAYSLLPENLRKKTAMLVVGATDYYANEKSDFILEMEEKAKGIGAKIDFVGYIPHEDIARFYCAADLLVFPTIEDFEGLPLTIIEAQTIGLPVIATDVGGIRETVIDLETGFIYEPTAEPEVITQHLEKLIGHPILRKEFGQRAEIHMRDNFCRERMARDFTIVIKEILNASK